jgi:glucose/arabinose dehydrogenase
VNTSSALRRLSWVLVAVIAVAATFVVAPRHALGASVLSGFTDTRFARGFGGRLTTMTFASDGRLFVSEKQGSVRIVQNGVLLSRPYLTVATNTDGEKGLKSLVFDPAYASNRYVYVYYTDATTLLNKVSRFTTRSDDPGLADPASEVVLVSGIASGIFHSGGALAFGADGKLYISTGDASYSPNGQNLGNLNGKILRINRDGTIPSDNPFVGQSGKRAEIWAYGLRNPYTFAFNAGGRLFINDVGNATWEEINEGARGANYGWPTCEGACNTPGFVDPIYAYNHADGPGKSITGAVFYYGSMFPAGYSGDYFFGDYVGNYIKRYDVETGQVSTFATDTLYPVDLDIGPDGALYYLSVENREIHRIAYGNSPPPPPPPDGNLLQNAGFENTGTGWLAPWQFAVRSPAVGAAVRDTAGPAAGTAALRMDIGTPSSDWYVQLRQPNVPLAAGDTHTLSFDARASSPRSVRVAFQQNVAPYAKEFQQSFAITTGWTRYSATFSLATADPSSLFNINVGDTQGSVWLDNVTLTAAADLGQPPVATISQPAANTRYRTGDVITFAGSASDPEDGPLPASALTWEVMFHHDTHTHPFIEPFSGATGGTFTIPDTGESSANVWYRIHLTATDSDGNKHEVTRDILPLTAQLTLATVPTGLGLTLDGAPVTAPYTFTGVVGFRREVSAPATQTIGGVGYRFRSWSDGGAATHSIATPATNQTLTAVYDRIDPSANSIVNPGFEKTGSGWLSPWRLNVRSPAKAAAVQATKQVAVGKAALRVDVSAAAQDWSVQILQPGLPVDAGVQHTLSFWARASSGRTIRIAFQQNSSPYKVYFQHSLQITKYWARYTVRFTPTVGDPIAMLNFNLGAKTGSIWLDEVSLTR